MSCLFLRAGGALIGIYIYHKCTDRIFLIIVNATLFFSGLTLLFESIACARHDRTGSPTAARAVDPRLTTSSWRIGPLEKFCRRIVHRKEALDAGVPAR
jgi:hypothetical protein